MIEWIVRFLSDTGYLGVLLLMALENIVPPIPSELIMPFAGFAAGRGELSLPGVIAAGTVGSVLGNLPWYVAGRCLGLNRLKYFAARYGRWLTISASDVDVACAWFNRWGHLAVLLGRLVPAVRTLISIPAGLASLRLLPFLAYSTAGTLLWTGILAGGGYWMGDHYQLVGNYIAPMTKIVVAAVVVTYVYRLVFRGKTDPR